VVEDHDMRVECAREFAKLGAESQQLSRLTETISEYHTENLRVSGEIKTCLNKHLVATEGRLTGLEGSTRSAHKRLDTLSGKFWAILILIVSSAVGAVAAHLTGVW
jgi:hypothetical protein